MKKETVNIEVRVEDVKKLLRAIISGTHIADAIIVDVIIDNLIITPKGIAQLFMAFNGIRPSTPFVVGEEVMVDFDNITSWAKDKDRMVKEGYVDINNRVKGTITAIDLQSASPITVMYLGIELGGSARVYEEEFKEKYVFKEETMLE